jgi:hypothetical protein
MNCSRFLTRLLLLVALIAWSVSAWAVATPTVIQYKSDTAVGTLSAGVSTWKVNLPNPSIAGNCIIVGAWVGISSDTIGVSDDKSNTYQTGVTQLNDGTNATSLKAVFAPNVAGGTQRITVTFSGTTPQFVQVMVAEFSNVDTGSTVDGQNGALISSGSSLAPGSFTTASDGDLIIWLGAVSGVTGGMATNITAPDTWTAGANMTGLLYANDSHMALAYRVQATHGAINPSMTWAAGSAALNSASCIGFALKAASSAQGGDLAAGIRVRGGALQGLSNDTDYGTWTSVTAPVFQVNVIGNMIAVGWTGKLGNHITSITSSPSLTWDITDAAPSDSGGGTNNNSVQWVWAANATPGTTYAITFNHATTANGYQYNIFDISGAATTNAAVFDKKTNASTNNTTAPTQGNTATLTGPSITPTNTNELLMTVIQEDQETVTGMALGYFAAVDIGVYATSKGEGDQGLGIYYASSNSAQAMNIVYSGYESGVTGPQWYTSSVVAFKAPAAASGAPMRSLLGVGK